MQHYRIYPSANEKETISRVRSIRFRCIQRGHIACLPPSTGIVSPVIKEALSDARNRIASATSSGFPTRPKAWVVLLLSKNYKSKYIESYLCVNQDDSKMMTNLSAK